MLSSKDGVPDCTGLLAGEQGGLTCSRGLRALTVRGLVREFGKDAVVSAKQRILLRHNQGYASTSSHG